MGRSSCGAMGDCKGLLIWAVLSSIKRLRWGTIHPACGGGAREHGTGLFNIVPGGLVCGIQFQSSFELLKRAVHLSSLCESHAQIHMRFIKIRAQTNHVRELRFGLVG